MKKETRVGVGKKELPVILCEAKDDYQARMFAPRSLPESYRSV
jgi:hypothetical protein